MGLRFTLSVLDRFARLGRGTGTYTDYTPWHRVSRADPSSRGRSHLLKWGDRHRELLSDLELVAFFFSTMHPDVTDIREQFPLSIEYRGHELNKYQVGYADLDFPGTLEICKQLDVKHPVVYGSPGVSAEWVMTTDLLLTLKDAHGKWSLLAVSVKPSLPTEGSRSWQLLNIEREYWQRRRVCWLLITPDQYDALVADALKGTFSWAWSETCDQALLNWLTEHELEFDGANLTKILRYAASEGNDREGIRTALWHGIWKGKLLFDLRRGWRPSDPFIRVTSEEFLAHNPIVSGRSAWKV
ncbi:TnsA endonuclease N-terminal domain-containing protein [Duganella levis]|uniref:Transposase n=1 Tax=Duganella levis TaxID=2692169 RepID=A0ABW9VZ24_9BURK|nr:TnsA endonuclease N-terminal domain-containing protein [Duganella levis]MYN26951.1 transposase [Duganella levis]